MKTIAVVDFGSQYTQLIGQQLRYLGFSSETIAWQHANQVIDGNYQAVVLSGGPQSVYDGQLPVDSRLLRLDRPILGICYGLQLMVQGHGGLVQPSHGQAEFGAATLQTVVLTPPAAVAAFYQLLLAYSPLTVWMSHQDQVVRLPPDWLSLAATDSANFAVVAHAQKPYLGCQFHPEVSHTEHGTAMLHCFCKEVASLTPKAVATPPKQLDAHVQAIRQQIKPTDKVLVAISGGLDSTVLAALLVKALRPEQVICICIDNGLLRHQEAHHLQALFQEYLHFGVTICDASQQFLTDLQGVIDPETKRQRIGARFIEVFAAQATQLCGITHLAQGTLASDVAESGERGSSHTIKSHHNVGGLPERLPFKLLEPLRDLFKDEVRALGRVLGLPERFCSRQPFPGPGLAVRVVGEVTAARLATLRAADWIVQQELAQEPLALAAWQCFALLLPVKAVGVRGDGRFYEEAVVLRAVQSRNGMTAEWLPLPHATLARISTRLLNEVPNIARVLYDITNKPPGTIEWE